MEKYFGMKWCGQFNFSMHLLSLLIYREATFLQAGSSFRFFHDMVLGTCMKIQSANKLNTVAIYDTFMLSSTFFQLSVKYIMHFPAVAYFA